MSGDVAV